MNYYQHTSEDRLYIIGDLCVLFIFTTVVFTIVLLISTNFNNSSIDDDEYSHVMQLQSSCPQLSSVVNTCMKDDMISRNEYKHIKHMYYIYHLKHDNNHNISQVELPENTN